MLEKRQSIRWIHIFAFNQLDKYIGIVLTDLSKSTSNTDSDHRVSQNDAFLSLSRRVVDEHVGERRVPNVRPGERYWKSP